MTVVDLGLGETHTFSAVDRNERVLDVIMALDTALRSARAEHGIVHELGCRLQEVHEEALVALEQLAVGAKFGTAAEASGFVEAYEEHDGASLVEQELKLLSAAARWQVLAAHDHGGDFRARLVALVADRLRVQAELARALFGDLSRWRPTPYWTLRNVAGGDYPRAYRGWSDASRAAFDLREQATEALRELQVA